MLPPPAIRTPATWPPLSMPPVQRPRPQPGAGWVKPVPPVLPPSALVPQAIPAAGMAHEGSPQLRAAALGHTLSAALAVQGLASGEPSPKQDWKIVSPDDPVPCPKMSPNTRPSPEGGGASRVSWSREEDEVILAGVAQWGHKWHKISRCLTNRSVQGTRNRYARLQTMLAADRIESEEAIRHMQDLRAKGEAAANSTQLNSTGPAGQTARAKGEAAAPYRPAAQQLAQPTLGAVLDPSPTRQAQPGQAAFGAQHGHASSSCSAAMSSADDAAPPPAPPTVPFGYTRTGPQDPFGLAPQERAVILQLQGAERLQKATRA